MTTLGVKEMSCNHCVERIHNLLNGLGVDHTISLEDKTVSVSLSQCTLEQIINELDDIGFTAIVK